MSIRKTIEPVPRRDFSAPYLVNDERTLFRMYIASETAASTHALSNLNAICSEYIHGRYEIEVVDILAEPLRALSEGVIATPTLIRLLPLPTKRLVGDLSDTAAVLHTLGLSESGKK